MLLVKFLFQETVQNPYLSPLNPSHFTEAPLPTQVQASVSGADKTGGFLGPLQRETERSRPYISRTQAPEKMGRFATKIKKQL